MSFFAQSNPKFNQKMAKNVTKSNAVCYCRIAK